MAADMSESAWSPFEPVFPKVGNGPSVFADFARELATLQDLPKDRERNITIESRRRRALRERASCAADSRQVYVAAIHVLSDLVKQGWNIRISGARIEISRPEIGASNSDENRERIRNQLHAERDEQLLQPATKAFIRSMEARQLFGGQFVSIFSLMRDGRELTAKCEVIRQAATDHERLELASAAVKPYVQFIRGEERCSWTGFRLVDIWRYFRHTWANPYKSVPGRSMMVLVRDAAAPCHPVIGIADLSSAAVAVTVRDDHIGWTAANVFADLNSRPTIKLAKWLKETTDAAIDEIYKVDLFEDQILAVRDLKKPSSALIRRLEEYGRQKRLEHHRYMDSGAYKKTEAPADLAEEHWEAQARTSLFQSKRALDLAQLLGVRMVLGRHFKEAPSKNSLIQLLSDREGREAVAKIVRKAKADRVGNAIADLTVCGALPPYNEILGGKLVAMLMVSPEIVQEYQRRYGSAPSIIASSMAGRSISRPADLVFIGTTSLYGQRPSQYDRIRIPDGVEPGREGLRYEYLGRTRGIGTFQFSDQTVVELKRLVAQSKSGQQVNSVFGEGVNPRLRKIRDGLDALGLATDNLLDHGAPRLVYGVRLARNVRDYLLGIDKSPKYILGLKKPRQRTTLISDWWAERWLMLRIVKDDVLKRIAAHNLVHPIKHGARVDLHREEGYLPGFKWD
jgi:hypothetical protein